MKKSRINKIRSFLCNTLTKITRHPRYQPHIKWDDRLYIANIFRFYEYLFGRREGIRVEVISFLDVIDGKLYAKYELKSFEAHVVHLEVMLRMYLSLIRSFFTFPQAKLDYTPIYLTLGFLGMIFSVKTSIHMLPLVGLAIAHDADSNSGIQTSSTSYNWSHTCTGSNLCLVTGFAIRPTPVVVSTLTYNSNTLTKIRADNNPNRNSELWYILNPSTGANSIAVTLSGATPTNTDGHAVSLSGVLALDANNGANAASGTTASVNVTTVAANSWIVDILCTGQDDGVATPGGSQTLASKVTNTGAHTGAQSYQGPVVSPGSTAMTWTVTNNNWCISAASFSPYVAPSTAVQDVIDSEGIIPYER